MFRKTKQSLCFGMAILGALCIITGVVMLFLMNPKKTLQQEISFSIRTPTTPDQFQTHTRASTSFALRERSFFSRLFYNDLDVLSPPTWKLNFNDANLDIREMVRYNMSPPVPLEGIATTPFTYSNFILTLRDGTLSLLCSAPDGYSRLCTALVNSETAIMTIVPKPTDLSILYLPEGQVQANVSKVGNAIATSADNKRLYVSYYITDNIESQYYHEDQSSKDFQSSAPLLNIMHNLCGAISIYSWDDIALQWVINTTIQHPFGGRYGLSSPTLPSLIGYDLFGQTIIPWTLRDYATQTDSYMFTTNSHNNTIITYKEDTLYHYKQPANFTNGRFQVNETWMFVSTGNTTIDVYQWDHSLKTISPLLQTITATSSIFTLTNDLLFIHNKVYTVTKDPTLFITQGTGVLHPTWQINTRYSTSIPSTINGITLLCTDILGQVMVVFSGNSYTVYPIHTMVTKLPITKNDLAETPVRATVIFTAPNSFLLLYSSATAFYCDLFKSA